jgi:hypothetical protein
MKAEGLNPDLITTPNAPAPPADEKIDNTSESENEDD